MSERIIMHRPGTYFFEGDASALREQLSNAIARMQVALPNYTENPARVFFQGNLNALKGKLLRLDRGGKENWAELILRLNRIEKEGIGFLSIGW